MPVTIPAVTLVDVATQDLRELHFMQIEETTGPEGSEVTEKVWYVDVRYVIRTDAGEVYVQRRHRVGVWPALLSLMVPVAQEVVDKVNIVEGM